MLAYWLCLKFTWMNHKNRRHVCVWMKSTPLKYVDHESKKRKRNVNDETDTIRMGWSGLCSFLCMPVKSDFVRNSNLVNTLIHYTHTLPYLVCQTRIECLSTWIIYNKKNSNHILTTKTSNSRKYYEKLISFFFCFCFRLLFFIWSSHNAYLEDALLKCKLNGMCVLAFYRLEPESIYNLVQF